MTVAELCYELELTLSDIGFTGLRNTQPAQMQKLERLQERMNSLGMNRGSTIITDFAQSMRDYQLGRIPVNQVVEHFCSLEFYVKNVLHN